LRAATARANLRGVSDLVWSSDGGDRRGQRRTPPDRPRGAPGGRVRVRREVAGRRGKAVTTVTGVPLADADLRALAGG
jgi:translation initiation factor 1